MPLLPVDQPIGPPTLFPEMENDQGLEIEDVNQFQNKTEINTFCPLETFVPSQFLSGHVRKQPSIPLSSPPTTPIFNSPSSQPSLQSIRLLSSSFAPHTPLGNTPPVHGEGITAKTDTAIRTSLVQIPPLGGKEVQIGAVSEKAK